MRIAVFSDIHGNLAALEAVLADIRQQRADRLVCLGDLLYKGPWPGECVTAVQASGALCVHGNTDWAVLRAAGRLSDGRPIDPQDHLQWHVTRLSPACLDYLEQLPRSQTIEADGQRFLFAHASVADVARAIMPGDSAATLNDLLAGSECDWVILGHTHVPYMFRLDGKRVINTGAVSRSLDGIGRPSYVVIDTVTGSVDHRRVDYDVDRALAAARERQFPFDLGQYERLLRSGTN